MTRPKYPPYRETGVAILLSHCVCCAIADYRCCTPISFCINDLSQSKDRPIKGGIGVPQKKLASEAYRAIGRRTKKYCQSCPQTSPKAIPDKRVVQISVAISDTQAIPSKIAG